MEGKREVSRQSGTPSSIVGTRVFDDKPKDQNSVGIGIGKQLEKDLYFTNFFERAESRPRDRG